MDDAMNITELLLKGGPVVWILFGYSVVGLGIVLERSLLFARLGRLPGELWDKLDRLLEQADASQHLANTRGPEAETLRAMLEARASGVKDLHGVGQRVRGEQIQRMEFGLRTLGILGNTAPLLGLLGTITGMIKAFMVIEAAGGKVDAQALAGGIWEAMITTGVGLAVAIPLLILLHFLEGAVERRVHSIDNSMARLLERRGNGHREAVVAEAPHHWEEITDGV
jgi:biopolymer transport protein ExbB